MDAAVSDVEPLALSTWELFHAPSSCSNALASRYVSMPAWLERIACRLSAAMREECGKLDGRLGATRRAARKGSHDDVAGQSSARDRRQPRHRPRHLSWPGVPGRQGRGRGSNGSKN